MRGLFVFATLAAVLLPLAPLSPPASAQTTAKDDFTASDADADGSIDRTEYRRRMVEVFYLADDNRDGVVVIEELREQERVDPKAFAAADKNGDGKLTLQEFVEYRMLDFTRADANKDGKLTVEEVEIWEKR